MSKYLMIALMLALSLLVACPGVPNPDGGQPDGAGQETVVDSGTDKGTQDTSKPDQGKPDTPASDSTLTPDTTKPDPGKPDTRTTDSVLTPDTAPDVVADTKPDTAPDVVADTAPDTKPDTTPDVVADTRPDTAPDVMTDTAPDTRPDVMTDEMPDITGLTCTERQQKSSAQVENTRKQHLACNANTECTTVSTSTGCRGACPAPVNTTGKPLVEGEVKKVNQTFCKDYRKDGCPYATPRCVNTKVLCDRKTCKSMDCGTRRTTARTRMKDVIDNNLKCTGDIDCVLVFNSTGCAGACQVAVNKKGEKLLKAEIADINATICADYRKDNCPYATPSCAAAKAKCTAGKCTSVRR